MEDERSRQPQQPQQQTLSRSSSATSTFVPQTFQQQPAPVAREYILTIPETQMPASQVIQLVSAEPSGNQRTAATQRAADFLHICWRPTTRAFQTTYFHTHPDEALQLSCLCHRWRKSTQHISTLKLLWESIVSDELPTDWHTAPPDPQKHAATPATTTIQQEHQQQPAQPQLPQQSATPNSSSSRATTLPYNWFFSGPLL